MTALTTGFVLAPEVQPELHQVFSAFNGSDIFAFFWDPSLSQVPIIISSRYSGKMGKNDMLSITILLLKIRHENNNLACQ